jgi:alkyl-hydroperoxide reductase/thiol specific antioxidant family protein
LRQRHAELQPARIVIITFASAAKATRALQPWFPFFEVWVDPEREAYRAWGLGSRRLGLLNLGTVRLYARVLLRGGRWRPIQWDFTQLGGDAVLDADGLVRLWHAGRTPDDRPPIEALIRAVNPEGRSAT